MKKFLTLLSLIFVCGTASADLLDGYTRITDLSQIEEGKSYFIVSDRTKFNEVITVPKAITCWQTGCPSWDNSGQNKYFVYWCNLDIDNDGFKWTAEKVGDSWAFKNGSNSKYLGRMHKNHPTYPHSSETDMVFADDAIGFTLTDLASGQGRFAFTSSDYTSPFTPQRYASNSAYDIALRDGDNDSDATDTDTYGYPGRWRLYETTYQGEIDNSLEDGASYYIINDVLPSMFTGSNDVSGITYKGYTGKLKAISYLQSANIHPRGQSWGDSYVYWGDFAPENEGYVFVAERNVNRWAFKNTKNGKYIGNEGEPEFSSTPVYFTISDLSEGANRFYIQPVNNTKGLHVQGYTYHCHSCLNLSSDSNNNGYYPARWHFVKVGELDNFVSQLLTDNAANIGVNEVIEAYADVTANNFIGKDGTCANLVLTDGEPFIAARDFTATNATYTRNVPNNWATICLPYAVSSNEDITYYTAGTINDDVLTLTSADDVPAGTPAICKFNSTGNNTITATNVTVATDVQTEEETTDDITLIGSFTQQNISGSAGNVYAISGGQFWKVGSTVTINPFRAYFTTSGSSSSGKFDIAVSDDNVTAIEALTGEGDVSIKAIYTADGMKIGDLQQGLNIVKLSNGKIQKILIK